MDGDEMVRHLSRAHDLARLAIDLPAATAADAWNLIRSTTEGPDGARYLAVGWVITRAYSLAAA